MAFSNTPNEEDSPFTKFCLETLSPIQSFTSLPEFKPSRVPLEPIPLSLMQVSKVPEQFCNCKKSQCQKLYCECFSTNTPCTSLCGCKNCLNKKSHYVRKEAKSPKGCNCKKTGCRKKYCECFQNKMPCSAKCRCEKCENYA